MALQTSDKFVVSRGGIHYQITGQEILSLIQASVGTTEYDVANIIARDAITGMTLGDRVWVDDASADGTVTAGWAVYAYNGVGWTKMAEEEGLDVVAGSANLAYTAAPTQGTVTSDNGTDATLTLADITNAGLMTPAQFTKLSYMTVTGAINLDNILSASHAAMTTGGSASTNPIVATGQALTFSIDNLTVAP